MTTARTVVTRTMTLSVMTRTAFIKGTETDDEEQEEEEEEEE